ncbi:MAG: DUF1080 domain-containing protein [Thermoguttaceae bacterium]
MSATFSRLVHFVQGHGLRATLGGFLLVGAAMLLGADQKPWSSGIKWNEPKAVEPGDNGGPPSDAIVLFDGKDLSQWQGGEKWPIVNGYATAAANEIRTKRAFGDCQLHLEWATPDKAVGHGQERGNSGVFLMGLYEIQILDSFQNPTYFDGQAAAVYKQRPPLVNACRRPGQWQSYDIVFEAPRFAADGKLLRPAFVTVFQNGVLVQNHFPIQGGTAVLYDPPTYKAHPAKLPLSLQYHSNPVRFRNIWIRELPPAGALPSAKAS